MNKTKRYQVNPVVSYGEEEDGAVLFNPDTDDTVIINTTGQILWNLLKTPHTVEELSEHLTEKYQNISIEQVTEDVTQFVQALIPDFLSEVD